MDKKTDMPHSHNQSKEKVSSLIDLTRFSLFSLTLAIATLFHYQAFHKWDEGILVWMAAIGLLFKPSSLPRFLLLITLQLFQELLNLPEKHNHWLLATIVNMTILAAFIGRVIREKTIRIHFHDFWDDFAPYLRLELIILYFFAVFHKLNIDFFNPEISCGAYFYKTLISRLTFFPDQKWIADITIYMTLFMETLIPLLLISKTRRNLGILIACIFHGVIGFNPVSQFWNFSSIVYALLTLFMPADFSVQLHFLKYPYVKSVLATLVLVGILANVMIGGPLFEVGFGLALWVIYMAISITLVYKIIGRKRILRESPDKRENIFTFHSPILLIFPIFLFFNGFSPYVGLKTESSFSMFSNLKTEGGESNHLLIPSRWQIYPYQKDLVEIRSSSDPYLIQLSTNRFALTYYEFRKYLKSHPQITGTLIRNGQIYHFSDLGNTEEFRAQIPWYYRAYLVFRPVSLDQQTPCTR